MILANARLILSDRIEHGAVEIADGSIARIIPGTDIPPGAEDMGGDFLAPGFVELHTDNLERHLQPRPGAHWPHDAAIVAHDAQLAACGITTVFDAMRVGSIGNGEEPGEYAKYARALATELMSLRRAGALKIDHYIHLRAEVCSETLVAELDEFGPADGIGIISLMDHTPGQRQFRDVSKLAQYVKGKHGLNGAEFELHVVRLRDLRDRFGDAHEAAAVAVAGRLGAVMASHDDTTAAHVATSAAYGIRVAEFPTTIEAARACHDHKMQVIMGAPNLIRGGSHSGNVSARELAEAGLLDIVSSDYVPSALLGAAFMLGEIWDDLPRGIATVTANPASAAGLMDRGQIKVGQRADIIRITMVGRLPVLRGTWVMGRRV